MQIRRMFQGDAHTSWVYPQPVVLEFVDYHGPVVVLAGDYMSPPPQGQPRPGLGMPEVIASTKFSRRGYTPYFPSSDGHAGDIYISFHSHVPPPDPESGRRAFREDSHFFRMMRAVGSSSVVPGRRQLTVRH